MKLQVNTLMLEVTRRCNMKCEHCLRGDAQPVMMTPKILDTVLSQLSYISSVLFTGGEPSLNVPVIKHFTSKIRGKKKGPDSFDVVTNGKANAKQLALALIDLYSVCIENAGKYIEESVIGLFMSRDQYHEKIDVPPIFKALKFFREDSHNIDILSLISEGRAALMGDRDVSVSDFDVQSWDNSITVDNLYIAANGNVISDCDYSYERVDSECFGNVLERPLMDILKPYIKKEAA